jgi:Cof subfamily protein (haloacid dehalogenase superfamily)
MISELLLRRFPEPPITVNAALDESLVRQLLQDKPRKIAHSIAVARLARQLSLDLELPPAEAQAVELAALFHDIGYALALQFTGFHPLDSAIFLAHQSAPEAAIQAVLLHRSAKEKASAHPAASSIYAVLPLISPHLADDLVDFCDLRISPEGTLVTLKERLKETGTRYGPEHPLSRHNSRKEQACQELQAGLLRQIGVKAPHPLPWVFLDVDHTLLEPGETLSARSLDAIEGYRQQGGRISLATGKHAKAIQGIASRLKLAGPHAAGNGCLVFAEEELMELASLGSVAQKIAAYLRELQIPYIAYNVQGIFGHPELITEAHFQAFRALQEPTPFLRDPDEWDSVFKVITFLDDTEQRMEKELREAAPLWNVDTVRTSSRFLEFVPRGSGKGVAVQEILRRARWPQFHSLSVGDSENDLSMFRATGRSAAVGNATEAVRQSADLVIGDCQEEGVAQILEGLMNPSNLTTTSWPDFFGRLGQ